MPITLPNLDDRKYADLLEEGLALIPVYAPEWTNHNSSDPGITLIELFAYLTEMLIYRVNRVTVDNMVAFLNLTDEGKRTASEFRHPEKLAEEVRKVVLKLRTHDRAVTCQDFEELSRRANPRVARAQCVPRRALDPKNPASVNTNQDGHVSVIIVPDTAEEGKPDDDLIGELINVVKSYLDERRLLTTRVNVVGPSYLNVAVHVTLFLKPDAVQENVRTSAEKALRDFFSPLAGGPDKRGWPFGRYVYVSEVYALLDRLPGVDYVTKAIDPQTRKPLQKGKRPYPELTVVPDDDRRLTPQAGKLQAVMLRVDELVKLDLGASHISILDPKVHLSTRS